MVLLIMMLIPTFVALGFLVFGGRSVTLPEFFAQMGIQLVAMGIVCFAVSCQNTADVEIWNGRVAQKAREEVNCSHSYQCNCYQSCTTDSKGGQSCTTICQTCYEHSYDVEWPIYTTNRERIEIDTIDRQGLDQPPRWTSVKIGEPTAVAHSFTNYVKASPDTLFRHQGLTEKYKDMLPAYPGEVYDYYRINRLSTLGISLPNADEWNKKLSELNADLGARKQVNMVVVVVKDQPMDYFEALEQAWIGGKKNDVVLLVDVDSALNIQWVESMAWTDNKIFQVSLRDDVMATKVLDVDGVLSALRNNVDKNFVRKPMKDFEYLSSTVTPTFGQWLFAMIFGTALSIGLGLFFLNNDVFGGDRYGYYR